MTKKHRKKAKELRIVESEVLLNPTRTIKIEEIKRLVDSYKDPKSERYKYRIEWLILACCGMRPSEVVKLRVDNFTADFRMVRYRIAKPRWVGRKKALEEKSDLKRLIYKIRDAKIPEFLAVEIRDYCQANYYTFRGGKLFNNDENSLRKELSKKRDELRGSFLEENVVYAGPGAVPIRKEYRISCYSFRRFYVSYQHYINSLLYNPALALTITSREIGHTKVDTTMIYTHRPEEIGIEDFGVIRTFDQLFFQLPAGQKTLEDFI